MKLVSNLALLVLSLASSTMAETGIFVTGKLGRIDTSVVAAHGRGLVSSASAHVSEILRQHKSAKGSETFHPGKHSNKVFYGDKNHTHLRFEQTYEGIPVVDAAIVVHVDENGNVYAANGEYVVGGSIDTAESFTCDEAFASVMDETLKSATDTAWLTDCERKVVFDKARVAHLAWERTVQFHSSDGEYHVDKLYVSVATGALVAIRPQIMRAASLEVYDCHGSYDMRTCQPVTLPTSDNAVKFAIINTLTTIKFYHEILNRSPLFESNDPIVSHVHFGRFENGAFFNPIDQTMNYMDGDGTCGITGTRYNCILNGTDTSPSDKKAPTCHMHLGRLIPSVMNYLMALHTGRHVLLRWVSYCKCV